MPKEKTPMQILLDELIRYRNAEIENHTDKSGLNYAINRATELTFAERKMVEDAYDAGIQIDGSLDGSQYFDNRFGNKK